jgi:hypothetical protein
VFVPCGGPKMVFEVEVKNFFSEDDLLYCLNKMKI